VSVLSEVEQQFSSNLRRYSRFLIEVEQMQ